MDYGTDVSCTTGLDPTFALVSGTTVVAQALARRLQTPPGGLIDDPNYGFDLRSWVNAPLGARERFEASSRIEAECLKDERVESAEVTVTQNDAAGSLTVGINVELADGATFQLVLSASAVTVSVLEVS